MCGAGKSDPTEGLLALEGDSPPQADLAIACDAFLLIAAVEFSELIIERELGRIFDGVVEGLNLRLIPRSSRLCLIDSEAEGTDVGEASFAAAAIGLIR